MKPKCKILMRRLKRWIAVLDNYELNRVVSKEIDNFWYKQKLAELAFLLEMKKSRNVDYLQMEYQEIMSKLTIDQRKLRLLRAHHQSTPLLTQSLSSNPLIPHPLTID